MNFFLRILILVPNVTKKEYIKKIIWGDQVQAGRAERVEKWKVLLCGGGAD